VASRSRGSGAALLRPLPPPKPDQPLPLLRGSLPLDLAAPNEHWRVRSFSSASPPRPIGGSPGKTVGAPFPMIEPIAAAPALGA